MPGSPGNDENIGTLLKLKRDLWHRIVLYRTKRMVPRRKVACCRFLLAGLTIFCLSSCNRRLVVIQGAVVRRDADPGKQLPIAGADITVGDDLAIKPVKSDPNGYFKITLRPEVRRGQSVVLRFRHADYEPFDAVALVTEELFIARLVPIPRAAEPKPGRIVTVKNIRARYSEKRITTVDVGSAVKTFEVVNSPNVPCNGQHPCSPDGKWKATIGSASLDAGEGNEFRNARISCISGACPFTKIEQDGSSHGGRMINVSARDWASTTTFLLEAEVVHPMVSDIIQHSYPVIFEKALNFSLPATAEGPSIEAEVNGESIVFPLGPALCLSWADCTLQVGKDQSRTYRCDLKPGYEFR